MGNVVQNALQKVLNTLFEDRDANAMIDIPSHILEIDAAGYLVAAQGV